METAPAASAAWSAHENCLPHESHDVVLVHRTSDPNGARVFQDLRLDKCFFADGGMTGEQTMEIGKGYESVMKKVREFAEDEEGGKTKSEATFDTVEAFQCAVKKLSKEDKELFRKLCLQVSLYEDLVDCLPVKRLHAYKRMHDPEHDQSKHDPKHDLSKVLPSFQRTPMAKKAWYIVFPVMMFGCFFIFQSFMLHVATHYYVKYMEGGSKARQEGGGMLYDVVGEIVAGGICTYKPDWCRDVDSESGKGAVTEGSVKIPLAVLDASGVIPVFSCLASYALTMRYSKFNIGLWNKTFIVASCMAFLKGIFDAVTIMPDSIGWEACKDRLGDHKDAIANLHFTRWAWTREFFTEGLFPAFRTEFVGDGGQHVRYCADMMVSGHTYFAVLFCYSTWKQVKHNAWVFGHGWKAKLIRIVVGSFLILCVFLEMLLVAASRFHYTVDMLVAVVLVFLLFDSTYVEQLAVDMSEGFEWSDKSFSYWQLIPCKKRNAVPGTVIPSQPKGYVNYRNLTGHSPWENDDGPHPWCGAPAQSGYESVAME